MTDTHAHRRRARRWRATAAALAVFVSLTQLVPARAATVHAENLELLTNLRLTHPESDEPGEAPGDLAFWGDLVAVGRGIQAPSGERTRNGFVLADISEPAQPRLVSRFDCTNTGWDISMWDDLVILSQDEPSASEKCDAAPVPPTAEGAFAGLRIVSIANPAEPRLLASVRTGMCATDAGPCVGSHTHTVLPDLARDRLVVYANTLPASVVVVPLADPAGARNVGELSTLAGGVGGTNGCHDLQVLMSQRLAACSSINEVSLWDVSDPLAPVVFAHFSDPTMSHHHSAVFSPDGRTLVVQDESLTSLAAETSPADDGCLAGDAGALRFFDISATVAAYRQGAAVIPAPERTAVLPLPKAVTDRLEDWCIGHYGGVVPIPPDPALAVRNLLVMGWAAAGTWLVDFTDPARPRFVGHYYDTDPRSPTFTASSYWYRGHIYTNNGSLNVYGFDRFDSDRGLEVLTPQFPDTPGGRNLAVALQRAVPQGHLNPQTQECIGPCGSPPVRAATAVPPAAAAATAPPAGFVFGCRLNPAVVPG